MNIKITVPTEKELAPKIVVLGVGGGGVNAVNNMISANLEGVDFFAANTDAQALENSLATNKIKFGMSVTRGMGSGADPKIGEIAAEESADEIIEALENYNMVFVTAGMGGGTGTGGAPIVAKLAKERNILTIGVVTKPFHFEGVRRMKVAEEGLKELQQYVDTLIIIPNQNLFKMANEKTTFADAFKMADDVLYAGVKGVTDLITKPGLINLDFADIHTVMKEKGKAMMGTGEADGENRAINAAEAAISNPLLDHSSMKGAKGVLINITGGMDITLFEVDEAANRIKEEVDPNANIIFGSAFDQSLEGKLRVSVVATGIEAKVQKVIHDNLVDNSGAISLTKENKEQEQNEGVIDQSIENTESSANKPDLDDSKEHNPHYTDIKSKQHSFHFHSDEGIEKDSLKENDLHFSGDIGENQATEKYPKADKERQGSKLSSLFDIPTFLRNKKKKL